MNVSKCPYCFRPLGRWHKDPIRLPNGCPNVWVSETETTREYRLDQRFYKGFDQITEPEIQEIQDFLKQTEIANSITPLTIWSPLNTSGKFQVTGKHIKEMRDSVEKLLTLFGLTKTDYFNYDEEGNLITQYGGSKVDWTDPITNAIDLKKFQVKYIHIEDLRHYIQVIKLEKWNVSPDGLLIPGNFNYISVLGDLGTWNGHGTNQPYDESIHLYQTHYLVPNGQYWDLGSSEFLYSSQKAVLNFSISGNKLKVDLDSGGGVIVCEGIQPPPLGWGAGWDHPYAYYNNLAIITGHLMGNNSHIYNARVENNLAVSIIPTQKLTSQYQFSCITSLGSYTTLNAKWRIFGTDYDLTEYPYVCIVISFTNSIIGGITQYEIIYDMAGSGHIFTPGITHISNKVYDKRLFTTFPLSGQITADLFSEVPTITAISTIGIWIGIRGVGGGGSGLDYRADSEVPTASFTPGIFSCFFDDIGMVKKL